MHLFDKDELTGIRQKFQKSAGLLLQVNNTIHYTKK